MTRIGLGFFICLLSCACYAEDPVSEYEGGEAFMPEMAASPSVSNESKSSNVVAQGTKLADTDKLSTPTNQQLSAQSTVTPISHDVPSVATQPAAPEVVVAWQAFLTKLRSCDAGVYVLSQINPVISTQYGGVETDKITGWQENKCRLTIMYYDESDPRLSPNVEKTVQEKSEKYPAGQECHFSKTTIESLIVFDSNILVGGALSDTTHDPYSVAIAQECTPFVVVDGKKLS